MWVAIDRRAGRRVPHASCAGSSPRPTAGRFRAVRAVDTATDPDFQGRGIFRRLTLHGLEELPADGVALVFNTPNDKSLPGYLKMGWQIVGRAPVRVMPTGISSLWPLLRAGPPAEPASRSRCTWARQPADVFGDDDALARLVDTTPRARGTSPPPHSGDYLRWRYGFAPLRYRVVLAGLDHRGRVRGVPPPPARAGDRGDDLRRAGAREWAVTRARLMRRIASATRADYLLRIDRRRVARGWLPTPRNGPIVTVRDVTGPSSRRSTAGHCRWATSSSSDARRVAGAPIGRQRPRDERRRGDEQHRERHRPDGAVEREREVHGRRQERAGREHQHVDRPPSRREPPEAHRQGRHRHHRLQQCGGSEGPSRPGVAGGADREPCGTDRAQRGEQERGPPVGVEPGRHPRDQHPARPRRRPPCSGDRDAQRNADTEADGTDTPDRRPDARGTGRPGEERQRPEHARPGRGREHQEPGGDGYGQDDDDRRRPGDHEHRGRRPPRARPLVAPATRPPGIRRRRSTPPPAGRASSPMPPSREGRTSARRGRHRGSTARRPLAPAWAGRDDGPGPAAAPGAAARAGAAGPRSTRRRRVRRARHPRRGARTGSRSHRGGGGDGGRPRVVRRAGHGGSCRAPTPRARTAPRRPPRHRAVRARTHRARRSRYRRRRARPR